MKRGIELTFEQLFEDYYERLCIFLNLYTKDKSVIEDVVQDVFCNLWANRDFVEVQYVKSYLYAATRNGIVNYLRSQKLHTSLLAKWMDDENNRREALDCVDLEEFQKQVDLAVGTLSPKCKNVFKLSRYSNLSNKEIAREEGISEKMVEKHITIAVKKIKEFMLDSLLKQFD